jgi:hypothetical protein
MTGTRAQIWRAAVVACVCAAMTACRSSGVTSSAATDLCAAIVCAAQDACHEPGACDPATGACAETRPRDCGSGRICDVTDGQCHDVCTQVACTASDPCHVAGACDPTTGLCGPQSAKTCPPQHTCDPWTGLCKADDPCAGVVCLPSDLCHLAGTCDPSSGACFPETPVTCPPDTRCDPSSGLCVDPCLTVVCTAPDPCHEPGTCSSATGLCSAPTEKSCPAGLTCSVATGACVDLCSGVACSGGQVCDSRNGQCRSPIATYVAKVLGVEAPPDFVAFGPDGALYVASSIVPPTQSFDGIPLTSNGLEDLFVARYAGPGWTATWARNVGDASAQYGSGVAVTADGTLAVIGSFSGNMTIGSVLSSASPIDFLAAFSGADGSGRWARQFNDGPNGVLKAVAANPGDASAHGNRIAVCGIAAQAATDLVPGATYAPGNANDILIGVFDSSGNRLWSAQIGGAGNEECDALAFDDAGNLVAAGAFSGAALSFGGATSALTGPNASTRKFVWVATFDGATGTALASAAFKGSGGQATPTGLAVDSAGNVVVAGGFTVNLTVGSLLSSPGSRDAFVAKLSPSLAPLWAVRLGGPGFDGANGVAVDAYGDVLVTGLFAGTTSGAAVLTSGGSSDAFLLELAGATGATQYAAGFGDSSTQTGDSVAIDRLGANEFALSGTLNGSINFPAPAGAVTDPSSTVAGFLLLGTFTP